MSSSPVQELPSISARVETNRDAPLFRNFPALDGLRGLSILWVLSFHLPGQLPPLGNPLTRRGHLGVEIFFAISGFLVTRSLHQCIVRSAVTGTLAVLRDFFTRRVARIWPPYFLALAIAVVGMFVDTAFREHSSETRRILWSFPIFIANYEIPYHEPLLSLLVMWSLCFEEQFYVILAGLYLLGGKNLSRWLFLAALGSIALRLFTAVVYPEVFRKFVLQMELHWRFDSLAWGCLAWLLHRPIIEFLKRTRYRSALEALVVFCSVAACIPNPSGPLGQGLVYLLLAPAFAALVATVAFSSGFWLARLLSWQPLTVVGVISYELYLSHVPTYRVLARLHFNQWHWSYDALCIALSLCVAWAFHMGYSKPTQRAVRAWAGGRDAQAQTSSA